MITDKTWKFYWCHVHLIQRLTKTELQKYAELISLSNLPSTTSKLIIKAISIRQDEIHNNTHDALAVSSSISID